MHFIIITVITQEGGYNKAGEQRPSRYCPHIIKRLSPPETALHLAGVIRFFTEPCVFEISADLPNRSQRVEMHYWTGEWVGGVPCRGCYIYVFVSIKDNTRRIQCDTKWRTRTPLLYSALVANLIVAWVSCGFVVVVFCPNVFHIFKYRKVFHLETSACWGTYLQVDSPRHKSRTFQYLPST